MKRVAALLAAYVAATLLALPLTDVPVIDDWAYAYSVDQLLRSGQFRVLDYSCRYNLVQVLWGALFAWPAGPSFVALRASTLVLSLAGLAAFFDLLRRRTGDPSLALWATALIAFNPLYFRLALSFMTDVPLLAVVIAAVWLFDAGLRRRRSALLALGVTVAVAGYLVRELASVAPAALLGGALLARPRRAPLILLAALALLAGTGLGLELAWIGAQGVSSGLAMRAEGLGYVLDVPASLYATALLEMLLVTAAFVAPLALATIRGVRGVAIVLSAGALCAAVGLVAGAVPFGSDDVLSPLGLGMSRALLPGTPRATVTGYVLRAVIFTGACVSLAVLLHEALLLGRSWVRAGTSAGFLARGLTHQPTRGTASEAESGPEVPACPRHALDVTWLLLGVGQGVALLLLWLWQDRYDLVLVPSAVWLLTLRARRLGWRRRWVRAGVALFAVAGVLGTRDDFELNRAAWDGEAWLRQENVPAQEIDAGYALNGWRLYAHAEQFAPGFPPEDVPFLFSRNRLPYAVSTTPLLDAQVLREYRWRRTWLSEPRLYILRR
jgi:hypothetical protein